MASEKLILLFKSSTFLDMLVLGIKDGLVVFDIINNTLEMIHVIDIPLTALGYTFSLDVFSPTMFYASGKSQFLVDMEMTSLPTFYKSSSSSLVNLVRA